jgi:hypothetical protein
MLEFLRGLTVQDILPIDTSMALGRSCVLVHYKNGQIRLMDLTRYIMNWPLKRAGAAWGLGAM